MQTRIVCLFFASRLCTKILSLLNLLIKNGPGEFMGSAERTAFVIKIQWQKKVWSAAVQKKSAAVHAQLIREPCSQVQQNTAYGNTLAHIYSHLRSKGRRYLPLHRDKYAQECSSAFHALGAHSVRTECVWMMQQHICWSLIYNVQRG